MNLKTILNSKQKTILKSNGIIVHSHMTEEEIENFNKEIWSTKIPLEIINDILDTIDEFEKNQSNIGSRE